MKHSLLALAVISLLFAQKSVQAKESLRAEVKFTVAENGQLLSKSMVRKSGRPDYDKTAMTAVSESAPFPQVGAPGASTFIGTFWRTEYGVDRLIVKQVPSDPNSLSDGRKPMFDCACLKAGKDFIGHHWFPPKDATGGTLTFKIDPQGHPIDIKITRGGDHNISDKAALEALRATMFKPSFMNEKTIATWNYEYLDDSFQIAIVGEPGVAMVSTETNKGRPNCSNYVEMNNHGVERYLAGDKDAAKALFEQAHQSNRDYFPAIYNLRLDPLKSPAATAK